MRNEAPNCTRVEVIHVDFRLSAHVTGDAETRKTGEENRWRWMSAVVRGCPQPLSGLILSVSVLLILIAPGSHQLQHCCEVFLLLNSYQRASGLLVQSILSRPSLGHGHGGGGGQIHAQAWMTHLRQALSLYFPKRKWKNLPRNSRTMTHAPLASGRGESIATRTCPSARWKPNWKWKAAFAKLCKPSKI